MKLRSDLLFTSSVEQRVNSEEVFLPDTPSKILESGNFSKVPLITGYNEQEGYFFAKELEQPEFMKRAFEEPEYYIPKNIKNERIRKDLAKSIRKFYFDDKPIGYENISNLVDLYSDVAIIAGVRRATTLHLKSTNSPTYFYVFSYGGTMNLLKFIFDIDCPSALHGDDLGYLFYAKSLFWKRPVKGSENYHIMKTMTRLWTNFAKYGNPTPPGDSLTWKPATIDQFNYLNISGWDSDVGENPHPERNSFWEKAYEISSAFQTDFCDRQANWQLRRWTEITHNYIIGEHPSCSL